MLIPFVFFTPQWKAAWNFLKRSRGLREGNPEN
jgi:hypothetical protein